MKKYTNNRENKFVNVIFQIVSFAMFLSLYSDDWPRWVDGFFAIFCIGTILAVYFTPFKYYCEIASICISENKVEKQWTILWRSFSTCTLERANAVVFCRCILGSLYYVFSKCDLSRSTAWKIVWYALIHKAIVFPYDPQIMKDFPEMFA